MDIRATEKLVWVRHGRNLLALLVLALLLTGLQAGNLYGQATPGLIYKPATGQGASILDPNGDGFVSETPAGFIYSDVTESEIPYVPIYQTGPEPTRDVRTGPP